MFRADARITVLLALATLVLSASPLLAQTPAAAGRLAGVVTDASDGVLPGVTVVARTVDGRDLTSTVTTGAGTFTFEALPIGPIDLRFQLDGFLEATTRVLVPSGLAGGAKPILQRLDLISLAESVTVRGELPPPPQPPPPPRPVLAPVPEHDPTAVCGPAKVDADVPEFGAIRSLRADETKVLFATGDELLIDGDASTGLAVGQNFIVRRQYPTALRYGRHGNLTVMGEHSSGLLQVVAVDDEVSTAIVVYACDEMMRGDYLARFEPGPVVVSDPRGAPDYDRATRILFADAGQPLGVTGRMMVVDRGGRDDLRVGRRVTLFRRSRFGDRRPFVVGEAVVVSVRRDSATVRVEHATDVIFFGENGDWAAPQQAPARASN